jgi:hypothetical protein
MSNTATKSVGGDERNSQRDSEETSEDQAEQTEPTHASRAAISDRVDSQVAAIVGQPGQASTSSSWGLWSLLSGPQSSGPTNDASSTSHVDAAEAKAHVEARLDATQQYNFQSYVIRTTGKSYEAAIAALPSLDALQQLIDAFLEGGAQPEGWLAMGARYAMNAAPQIGTGALLGLGGALVTAPFTGGLSLIALGSGLAVGALSSGTSSVTRDVALDAGMSDRTANFASLAAGAFTGGAAGGYAKAGIKGIVTEGLTQGAKQAAMQLGTGGVCEVARNVLSSNEATKPYANAINEALAGAMQAQAGGSTMTVAAVKAAFGLVRGSILDGNIAIPEEQRAVVLMGLSLAEQAASSAVQNHQASGGGADLDGQEPKAIEPEEVVKPSIGDDVEPLAGMPKASTEPPAQAIQHEPVVESVPQKADPTVDGQDSKRFVFKLGDREIEIGDKGIKFQGKKWSLEAGRGELLAERSVTNAAGDNDTRSLSIGGGRGSEFVSSQTKNTGETSILRVGAGNGEGLRVESSHGTQTAEVTHDRIGIGGGSAASMESQHIHDGGSRDTKVALLPVSAQRQGNTISGSAALFRGSETVTNAGGSTTSDTALLPVAGSVIKEQTSGGTTLGATGSAAIGDAKVTRTGNDGSHAERHVMLVPVAGEGHVGIDRSEGTKTIKAAGQGSLAAARVEGHDHNADGTKAGGKLVFGEHAVHGQASATSDKEGLHASGSGGTSFTALRGHGEQITADGSRTEVGGVFGRREVTGQGSASMTKDGLAVSGGGGVHDSVLKLGAEQTLADGTKSAGSVVLGDWRRAGSVSMRGTSEGSHFDGKLEEQRTLASVAGSYRDEDGTTYGGSATIGKEEKSLNAVIDSTEDSTTFQGNGSIDKTKLVVAGSRVGVDGEKTTLGAAIGESNQQARGTLVHSDEGVHATGRESATSSKLRLDQRHTTTGGTTEMLGGVLGESQRTRNGELDIDEQGRRTSSYTEGNKDTTYRLQSSLASADHALVGGLKGQVKIQGSVEDSTSETKTVRTDSNGRETSTSTSASGRKSLAEVKAILKGRDGKVICSVGVDLKSAQTHEAAKYSASKIQAWISKMMEAPAQAEGEEPVESVIDDDDDMWAKASV